MYTLIYFALNAFFLLLSYSSLNKILSKNSIQYKYLSRNKQLYVLKNIVKSSVLCYLILFKVYFVKNLILSEPLINEELYSYTSNYVVNDFLGLVLCYNYLPRNTKFHHITSMILYIYIINEDFNTSLIARLILTYGIFSATSFIVNFYLALRLLYKDNDILNYVRITSIIVYIISISLNVLAHSYIIFTNPFEYKVIFYLMVLTPIINDDIVLMKWLMIKNN